MNDTIAEFIKRERKHAGLTQEEFAIRSNLGLRFIRELEQGKESCRMDKVNQALSMFGSCLGVIKKSSLQGGDNEGNVPLLWKKNLRGLL